MFKSKKVLGVILVAIGVVGLQSMLVGLISLLEISFTFKGGTKADYYFWRFVFGAVCLTISVYGYKNKVLVK